MGEKIALLNPFKVQGETGLNKRFALFSPVEVL
jgi:hypothetical protein